MSSTEEKWKELWDNYPIIHSLLKDNSTLEGAREDLRNYLDMLDWRYRFDRTDGPIDSPNYVLLKEALKTLRNIISPRNERLVKFIALEHLWIAAREGKNDNVSNDFIEEFIHLFKALTETSDVYPSWLTEELDVPDYDQYSSYERSNIRSDFLDEISKKMNIYLDNYPSGLDQEVIELRKKNKAKILEVFGGTEEDWLNYQWHFVNVIKDMDTYEKMKQVIHLTHEQQQAIELSVEKHVPFGITPHYLHLMDPSPTKNDYTIRKQVIPPISYVKNMIDHKDDRRIEFDFMKEADTSPINLITRRYPKVVILKPYDSCPQICVYCQRNWEITSPFMPKAMASNEDLNNALDFIGNHEEIMDVLVTGGDPLCMTDKKMEDIIGKLAEFNHIKSIRVATRTPVTVPQRFTKEFCDILNNYNIGGKRNICVVTHAQHAYEITPEVVDAISRLKAAGISVYNQQVFTFANSRRFETVKLRILLKQAGIDTYYTFNMKGKDEVEGFAVPVSRLAQERKEEARLLPGVFRCDEPVFNVPRLGKNHIRANQDHELISVLADGRRVYSFHPWEKNIVPVNPYLYTDVPIAQYLRDLKDIGENVEDYRSIWYYY